MALDLGTLTGYLEMDSSRAEEALDALPGRITGSGVLMGAAAAGVAALVGSSLADGIGTTMDLQDARAKLTAQLGLTGPESERLGKIAGTLYAQAYGGSIDEVNDAVANVVSSIDGMRGASNEAVSDMTAKVLNFNTTFGVDTARTTQIVGQLMKSGLVKDADTAMDLLTRSMQKVPTNVREDLLDAVDEYTPFFQQLGIQGDQAFSMLVDASAKGMYGIDKTGDAIKEFSIRATDLNDTGAQASLASLGLSGTKTADDLLKGGKTAQGAMQDVVKALLSVEDPGKRAALAGGLFGTQIEDLNKGQLGSFLSSLSGAGGTMDGVAGATDRMGKAINGTASVGLEQFNRSWDQAVGTLVSGVVPILGTVLDFLNKHPTALKIVAGAVGILALAFAGLTVATWAMNTALLANPITWIVLAIVAAVAALAIGITLLVTHWSEVTAWLGSVGGAIWGWLQGVIQGFVDWWNGLWGGFGSGVQDAWSGIQDVFAGIGAWWSGLWAGFGGMLADGWDAVLAYLTALPGQFVSWLTGLGSAIVAGLQALPGLLYEGLVTAIAFGLAVLYTEFVTLPQMIVGWLVGAAQWLYQTGTDILTGLWNGIVAGYVAVTAWFAALPGAIAAFFISAATWLLAQGVALLNGLQSGITTGYSAVIGFFSALPGRIVAFVVSFTTLLVTWGVGLLTGLANGISSGAQAVWAFMTALPGRLLGYAAVLASLLISRGASLLQGLASGAQSGASAVWSFMSGLPGEIMSRVGNLGGALISSGRALMDGLLSGIRSGLGAILGAISGMAGDIMGRFKSILGIASPSKVFRSYGQFIGQGLVLGMADLQSDIDSQVGGMVGTPRLTVATGATGMGADGTAAGVAGGVYVTTEVHGNVGWDIDEVSKRQAESTSRAMALAGLRGPIGVA